ncbi:MAG TPA: hypothetical protein VNH41_12010, partial [Steroidobacteraceae bacterium]|nr:hypothetical protein [Steroidobacteraceae bacterium]
WYLVHNRTKRLPPVAIAFKEFLVREGAPLIERLVQFGFGSWPGGSRAHATLPAPAAPAAPARRRAARPI